MTSVDVRTSAAASKLLARAGFCLRYGAHDALPIASIYQAAGIDIKTPDADEQKIAIELTNELLARHEAIEVTVIADRVCLVHRDLMPALYKMVRQKAHDGSIPELSDQAREVLALFEEKPEIVTGDVRRLLGIGSVKSGEDRAYTALGELQRHLLIDRGPFKITNQAIPYLSKEGYPYHLFVAAHAELVKTAQQLSFDQARDKWLLSFLKASPNCSVRKISSMFKTFLSAEEIEGGLNLLVSRKQARLEKSGRHLTASVI